MSIQIGFDDILRLVEQFLFENNLTSSLKALRDETGVTLNLIQDTEQFALNFSQGKWDLVLDSIKDMKIPLKLMTNLYEHIFYELVEMQEIGAAREFLRNSEIFFTLKEQEQDKYLELESLLIRINLDKKILFGSQSKQDKRNQLCKEFLGHVKVAPPNRLMTLISQAITFQREQGLIPENAQLDLYKDALTLNLASESSCLTYSFAKITGKFTTCLFSMNYLITGNDQGLIQLYMPLTGTLAKLDYQENGSFMQMDSRITHLSLSKNKESLISSSVEGSIHVWKLESGQLLRRFPQAHSSSVTCAIFTRDQSQVLSCGHDKLIKLFGMRSGKCLKEFRGHTSFVNCVDLSLDGDKMFSVGSDCTLKTWDIKTGACLSTVDKGFPLNSIQSVYPDLILLCGVTKELLLCSLNGQLVRSFKGSKDFVSCRVSDKLVYGSLEDQIICFDFESGKVLGTVETGRLASFATWSQSNVVATIDSNGSINLWK